MNVLVFGPPARCIMATMVDESMPPERNAPSGTSEICCSAMTLANKASSSLANSSDEPARNRLTNSSRRVEVDVLGRNRLASSSQIEPKKRARAQLGRGLVNRGRRWHIRGPQERRKRRTVDGVRPFRVTPEAAQLGAKNEETIGIAVVERLLAEPITAEVDTPSRRS